MDHPMSTHSIRITWQQAGFDTPNVAHFSVPAKSPASAIAVVQRWYPGYAVRVEYITTFRH
jgi:hypothetical protein